MLVHRGGAVSIWSEGELREIGTVLLKAHHHTSQVRPPPPLPPNPLLYDFSCGTCLFLSVVVMVLSALVRVCGGGEARRLARQ